MRHRQPALTSNEVSHRFEFQISIVNCGKLGKGRLRWRSRSAQKRYFNITSMINESLKSEDKIFKLLDSLSELKESDNENYDILIIAGGGLDIDFFNTLNKDLRVEVLYSGWVGPNWTKFMSKFIAGESGLIRVIDKSYTKELFIEVASYSVSELTYASSKLTNLIRNEVSKGNDSKNILDLLLKDSKSKYVCAELDEPITKNNIDYYFCETHGLNIDGIGS